MFIKERKPYAIWVDERARGTPDRPYATTPRSMKLADGYVSFTYAQLAKAVDRMSWWPDQKLGKASSFDVVAYIGRNDLRYAFLYFAALKTQRQVYHLILKNNNCLCGLTDLVSSGSKHQTSATQSFGEY